jgi:hypothetical protein
MELSDAVSAIRGGLSAAPNTSTTALLKEYRDCLIAMKGGLDQFRLWVDKQRESFPFLSETFSNGSNVEEISDELQLFEEGKSKLGEERQTQMKAAFARIQSWFHSKGLIFLNKRTALIRCDESSLFSQRHLAVADELDQFARMLNGDTEANARELAGCFRTNSAYPYYRGGKGGVDRCSLRDIAVELKDKDESLSKRALVLAEEVELENWNDKWSSPLVTSRMN